MLLVKVDGKRVYDGNEFEVEQAKHRKIIVKKLRDVHNEIIQAMSKTFEVYLRYIKGNISIFNVMTPFLLFLTHFLTCTCPVPSYTDKFIH